MKGSALHKVICKCSSYPFTAPWWQTLQWGSLPMWEQFQMPPLLLNPFESVWWRLPLQQDAGSRSTPRRSHSLPLSAGASRNWETKNIQLLEGKCTKTFPFLDSHSRLQWSKASLHSLPPPGAGNKSLRRNKAFFVKQKSSLRKQNHIYERIKPKQNYFLSWAPLGFAVSLLLVAQFLQQWSHSAICVTAYLPLALRHSQAQLLPRLELFLKALRKLMNTLMMSCKFGFNWIFEAKKRGWGAQ